MSNVRPHMTTIVVLRKEHEQALLSIADRGFEVELVKAAFDNLEAIGPLCFNNFGYALRELLRHVFHRLAPDEKIVQCAWFKPDPTSRTGQSSRPVPSGGTHAAAGHEGRSPRC